MVRITDLPEEVIKHILSWLPFRQIEVAAQVCHLWNRLAFSGRFCLHLYSNLSPQERRILLKSIRSFRHVLISLCQEENPISQRDISSLVAVVGKHGPRIKSIEISGEKLSIAFLLRLLEVTPNLRKITYDGAIVLDGPDVVGMPAFQSVRTLNIKDKPFACGTSECRIISVIFPSLTSIIARIRNNAETDLLTFYGEQLKGLHADVHDDCVERFCDLDCLGNLTRITLVTVSSFVSFECFRSMKHLTNADLRFTIENETFQLMCSTCTLLKTLHFEIDMLDTAAFRLISTLRNLKEVGMSGSSSDRNFLQGIVLPRVECLDLGWSTTPEDVYRFLPMMVPNLRSLRIRETKLNNSDLELISLTMSKLEIIEINNCIMIEELNFAHLGKITHLIELNCYDYTLGDYNDPPPTHSVVPVVLDGLMQMVTPCSSSLQVFGIDRVPTPTCLLEISKAFPNLRTLVIFQYENNIGEHAVPQLQAIMPNLHIKTFEDFTS